MPFDTSGAADALRRRRIEFVKQLDLIDSPMRLFDFQRDLANEIRAVEPAAYRDRGSLEREHLKALRLIGDAIAWQTLHPHTIRQLSKHPGKPPALGSQGEAFEFVIACARMAAEARHPVRICDLTNVLRIGDLIIGEPEQPMLIECAPDAPASFRLRGRKARQLARMEAVAEVLRQGHGHVPGTPAPIKVYESPLQSEYSWHVVESAARAALANGAGLAAGDSDVVWALRADATDAGALPLATDVADMTSGFSDPLVALSSTLLDEPSPLVPPPLAWPLPLDLRLALLEREIRLVHVVDLARFLEIEHEGARIIDVRRDQRGDLLEACFIIQSGDLTSAASRRFVDDVIYGFMTIESSVKALLSCVGNIDESEGHELHSARTGPLSRLLDELVERQQTPGGGAEGRAWTTAGRRSPERSGKNSATEPDRRISPETRKELFPGLSK